MNSLQMALQSRIVFHPAGSSAQGLEFRWGRKAVGQRQVRSPSAEQMWQWDGVCRISVQMIVCKSTLISSIIVLSKSVLCLVYICYMWLMRLLRSCISTWISSLAFFGDPTFLPKENGWESKELWRTWDQERRSAPSCKPELCTLKSQGFA